MGALAGAVALTPGPRALGQSETALEARSPNQKHNAKLACQAIDGHVVPPGGVFSFNKAVGSWSRDKGYRRAPVSFNGTLIDAWGGGVCQTSTTFYSAALFAGMEVVERHAHHFCPTYSSPGRDAAVAYPNIDLRMRNPYGFPLVVRAKVEGSRLKVSLVGAGEAKQVSIVTKVMDRQTPQTFNHGSGDSPWVRAPGKPGFEVETYRITPEGRARISRDIYPVMHRVVQWSSDGQQASSFTGLEP